MSSSRPSSTVRRAGTSRHRLAAPAAALAGLALLGACGTVSAQSADSTGATAPPSTSTSAGTPAPTPTPTPGAGASALRVRVPLALPGAGGQLSGEVTGIVTIGLNQCLFLRTDAGQRFGLVGTLADHVRTLLIARMVPLRAGGADPAPTALSGSYGVRVQARGSVTTGASVCSSPYEFTASSGDVDGSITPLR